MLEQHDILTGIWAIDSRYALRFMPTVLSWLDGSAPITPRSTTNNSTDENKAGIRFATLNHNVFAVSDYGYNGNPDKAPANSIAVIDIVGAITKYDQQCGPSGMQTKSQLLKQCYNNPNIKGIVLNIDSGGGEGYAGMLAEATIRQKNKPVIAFQNDLSASAAYMISCACDLIVAASPMTQVGSVGTYITIADYAQWFKLKGIDLKDVYADASTEKNKAYRDALNGDMTELKKNINQFNDAFLNTVSTNRGANLKNDDWKTGRIYYARDAKTDGIIDEIASFEDCLQMMEPLIS